MDFCRVHPGSGDRQTGLLVCLALWNIFGFGPFCKKHQVIPMGPFFAKVQVLKFQFWVVRDGHSLPHFISAKFFNQRFRIQKKLYIQRSSDRRRNASPPPRTDPDPILQAVPLLLHASRITGCRITLKKFSARVQNRVCDPEVAGEIAALTQISDLSSSRQLGECQRVRVPHEISKSFVSFWGVFFSSCSDH